MEQEKNEIGTEPSSGKKTIERWKKVTVAVAGLLVLVIVGIYIGVAMHYKSHFLPNTSINNMDCSGLDAAQVAGMLENQLQNYTI